MTRPGVVLLLSLLLPFKTSKRKQETNKTETTDGITTNNSIALKNVNDEKFAPERLARRRPGTRAVASAPRAPTPTSAMM